jgi:hypothetical protein
MTILYNNLELNVQSNFIEVISRDPLDRGKVTVYMKNGQIKSLSGTLKLTPMSEVKYAANKAISKQLVASSN